MTKDPVRQFEKVHRVQAPEFLYTRILASVQSEPASSRVTALQWGGAIVLVILFVFNLRIIMSPGEGDLVSAMALHETVQLYDEN
ncbi:MAG: hypothetical protein ACK5FV_02180 [Bacteroidota bacterium]|jgi:hypothetical protein|nr:hypothetical protein [Saprospiraceae bacterium]